MPPRYLYLNGRVLSADQAHLSPWERGWLFGQGLFETLRSYHGVPFLLEEHQHRLETSAQALGLSVPSWDPKLSLRDLVGELLRKNRLPDAYIRIILTGGVSEPPDRSDATTCILVRPLHRYDPLLYRRGAKVIVSAIRRNPTCPLAAHKTLNYWANLIARQEATKVGATEAILLDTRGYLAEGAASNVFFVRDGRLLTPSLKANILPGITRAKVIELAKRGGVRVSEGLYRLKNLQSAEEVFLTNSLMEVMPVRSINGRHVGTGRPGAITRQLMRMYQDEARCHSADENRILCVGEEGVKPVRTR